MMGVADRDRQRIGGVAGRLDAGQQAADHHGDLALVGVARAGHRLLHEIGGILEHRQAGPRRRQHDDAARLAELQRRSRIDVHEGLLDRRLERPLCLDDGGNAVEQFPERSASVPEAATLTTPCATWRSRLPSTSITPQPVSRRPGSRPISLISGASSGELRQSVVRHLELA